MNSHANLITMLDELNLPVAAERLTEILNSPELSNYSPVYGYHGQALHDQSAAQQAD